MALDLTPYFTRQVPGGAPTGPLVRAGDTGAAVLSGALGEVARVTDIFAEEEATRTADTAYLDAVKAQSDFQDSLKSRQDYDAFTSDYQKTWQQQKQQILGNLSGRAKRKVEGKLAYLEAQGFNQVRGLAWDKQKDVGRAQLVTQADQAFEVIGRDPFGESGQQAFAGVIQLYANAANTGLISQEAAAEAKESLEQRLGVTQVSALVEANPYEARKRLASGEFDSLLQPEKKAQLVDAATREIKAREAEARAAAAAARAEYGAGLEDYLAFVADGNTPTPEQLQTYSSERIAKVYGDKAEPILTALDLAQEQGNWQTEMHGMTVQEINAKLQQEATELAASPENYADRAKTYNAMLKAAQSEMLDLSEDPAAAAVEQDAGVRAKAEEYRAAAAAGSEDAGALLADFTASSVAWQEARGLPAGAIKPWTDQQLAGFVATYEKATPQEKAAMAASVGQGMPSSTQTLLREQVAAELPSIGFVGDLAREAPDVATKAVQGAELRKTDKALAPEPSSYETAVNDYFGDAFASMPEIQAVVRDAALDLYAQKMAAKGDRSGTFDRDVMEEALAEASGGVVRWNDAKVVAPIRGMTEESFESAMETLADADLERFGNGKPVALATGEPITADMLRDYGLLRSLDGERYAVLIEGSTLMTEGGAPYEIDLSKALAAGRIVGDLLQGLGGKP